MTYEVEQKFRVVDLDATEETLSALGYKLSERFSQSDKYFSHPARDFRRTDEILRLRRDGKENFVTYKGERLDDITKTRVEIELTLPSGQESAERFNQLLTKLGFDTLIYVSKNRRKSTVDWQGSTIEIALDEVEHLGTFVELETLAEESNLDQSKARVASLNTLSSLRTSVGATVN